MKMTMLNSGLKGLNKKKYVSEMNNIFVVDAHLNKKLNLENVFFQKIEIVFVI